MTDHETPNVQRGIEPFAMVPEWVIYHEGISPAAVRLYAALDRHEGPSGVYPSRARLARLLSISDRHIRTLMAELVEAGAVEIIPRWHEDGSQTSNLYRLPFRNPASGGGAVDVMPPDEVQVTQTRTRSNDRSPSPTGEGGTTLGPIRSKLTEDAVDLIVAEYANRHPDPRGSIDRARGYKTFAVSNDKIGYVKAWLDRDIERASTSNRRDHRGRSAPAGAGTGRYPAASSGRLYDA